MTPTPQYRQLQRSQTDRKISGVCGGIAEYLNVDPTVVRIAAVALTVITGGAFIIAYVIAMVVMPQPAEPGPTWRHAGTDRPGPTYPGPGPTYPGPTYPGPDPGYSGPGTTPQGEPFPGYPGATTPTNGK